MKKMMKLAAMVLAGAMAMTGCSSAGKAESTQTAAKEAAETGSTADTAAPQTDGAGTAEKTGASWPAKQISIICPYSAGGAADTVSRAVAAELQNVLGVPVVVVNKTGAAGAVGIEEGKSAAADGYTVTYVPVESTFLKFLGTAEATAEDFQLFGRVMLMPASIVVRADSEWETLDDFLAYAKANPGKVTVGNPGAGSNWYMAVKALEKAADASFTHVPFDGSSAAITGLLGKNVTAVSIAPGEAAANIAEGGDLKVLALLSGEKSATYPDIPLAKDMGYDVSFQGWASFGVPLNTPAEVVNALEEALAKAADTDTVKDVLSTKGFDYAYLNAKEMTDFAASEQVKYEAIIKELGLN